MAEKKQTRGQKIAAKKRIAEGDSYVCEVCGLAISVDEVCGCVDVCDIICCGKLMKEKRSRVKAAKK